MVVTRFERFGNTPLGQRLAALIDVPERYVEFRAFSREGFPAITALVSVLAHVLEPLRHTNPAEFDAAKQYVGWFAGTIMRNHGHIIARKSASVPGKLFNVGAIWSAAPEIYGEESQDDSKAA
jgi:uncharacterized protein (DUF3820 family)